MCSADHPGPMHNKSKMAMMYDAWEYFRDHGADLLPEEGWAEQKVTLFPGTGGKAPLIKYVLSVDDVVGADGKFKGDKVETRLLPLLHHLTGYETTAHSKANNLQKKFAAFSVSDCSPAGEIEK